MLVELAEYESAERELSAAAAADLVQLAGPRLGVGAGSVPGRFVLTATAHVGVLVTPAVSVLVRPKVNLRNLFVMLGVSPPDGSGAQFGFGTDRDLLSVMAAVFANEVDRATVRGVLRGYRHTEERLVSPRGRLDIVEQLRRPGLVSPVACRFDEYTSDFFPNRALVCALDRLHRVPGLEPQLRTRLNRLAGRFEDVAHVPVDVAAIDRWRPTRLDQHYSTAMRLAAVILRNLSLAQDAGGARAASFTVNMNDLFQDFVTDRLRRSLRGRLDVVAEPVVPLVMPARLNMQPDLVFRRQGVDAYVGDTKYKLSSGPGRITDYYQLLAYQTAMALDEGVLVYAQDPGDPADPLDGDLVHTAHIRNTSKVIHVYRIPMGGSSAELEAAVARLADWVAQRSESELEAA